jgi:hypothetical protein
MLIRRARREHQSQYLLLQLSLPTQNPSVPSVITLGLSILDKTGGMRLAVSKMLWSF